MCDSHLIDSDLVYADPKLPPRLACAPARGKYLTRLGGRCCPVRPTAAAADESGGRGGGVRGSGLSWRSEHACARSRERAPPGASTPQGLGFAPHSLQPIRERHPSPVRPDRDEMDINMAVLMKVSRKCPWDLERRR